MERRGELTQDWQAFLAESVGLQEEQDLDAATLQQAGELADVPFSIRSMPQDGGTDEATGLPLNPDGTVTVYHGTTAAKAERIRKERVLRSEAEPDVYVTTAKADTGYGDGTVIAVNVRPGDLILDDEFRMVGRFPNRGGEGKAV